MRNSEPVLSKHQLVYDTLRREIQAGKYGPGQKLPSEAALVQRFGVSRITAGRAVRDLQSQGLVERRAGSGTYVASSAPEHGPAGLSFGLLIPNLGDTEIFEPICRGMASSGQAQGHALLWGNAVEEAALEEKALQLCRQYIARGVDGVFFAPVELTPRAQAVNQQILGELDAARIPVVLLDRGVLPYPEAPAQDLVGIDNRRAGYIVTQHLAKQGCRRIAFAAYGHTASTVDARIAGYREAAFAYGAAVERQLVARLEPGAESRIVEFMRAEQADALVCANDRTAGDVMHALLAAGYRIPQDVRMAGIDDVAYARLLPVPLTTVRQPARQIGELAMAAMLARIERPQTPVHERVLACRLVVRQSCGAPR